MDEYKSDKNLQVVNQNRSILGKWSMTTLQQLTESLTTDKVKKRLATIFWGNPVKSPFAFNHLSFFDFHFQRIRTSEG